jgi:hypothetical protein
MAAMRAGSDDIAALAEIRRSGFFAEALRKTGQSDIRIAPDA